MPNDMVLDDVRVSVASIKRAEKFMQSSINFSTNMLLEWVDYVVFCEEHGFESDPLTSVLGFVEDRLKKDFEAFALELDKSMHDLKGTADRELKMREDGGQR